MAQKFLGRVRRAGTGDRSCFPNLLYHYRERQPRHVMSEDQSGLLTELLHHWAMGDEEALRGLVPLVYKALRRLAHYHLQSERPDHTLQSTALVHEAYLRMARVQPGQLRTRTPFTLGDHARGCRATQRDGRCKIAFGDLASLPVNGDHELLVLDAALDELSRI